MPGIHLQGHGHLLPQKVPGYYHIDLHVDDEDVIHQYGKQYGFKTCKVCEPDPDWVEKVLDQARRVRDLTESDRADKKQES